jgi:hypothetical protein
MPLPNSDDPLVKARQQGESAVRQAETDHNSALVYGNNPGRIDSKATMARVVRKAHELIKESWNFEDFIRRSTCHF